MGEEIIAERKRSVYAQVDALAPQLRDIAERIHAQPETSFGEYFASGLLADAVEKAGFFVERGAGGLETAFKAIYRGATPRPAVAFLAEYDALPEVGHACGHNLIAGAALGAAVAVTRAADPLPGSVALIGTPAEEEGGGKVTLARAGVFDDVDAALMFHPANKNDLWKYAMASQVVRIEFFGEAAHSASAPEEGINALDAVIGTFNNINALRQHLAGDVRIHGIVVNGGKAPNIVPDYASALFYVRSLDDERCLEVVEKVRNCARGASTATGARLAFENTGGYKTLVTNHPLSDAFSENMEDLGVSFDGTDPWDDLGSTDLGDVSHIVPAIHPYVAIGPESMGYHTTAFAEAARSEQGYRTMLTAAKAMAATAVDFLYDEDFRARVRESFRPS
ncbi:MAG: M20 family metallopeptidase [Spirochaetaceae bacterium]